MTTTRNAHTHHPAAMSWRSRPRRTRPRPTMCSTPSTIPISGVSTLGSRAHGRLGTMDPRAQHRQLTPATWALRCAYSPNTISRRVSPLQERTYRRFVKSHVPHAFRSRDMRNVTLQPYRPRRRHPAQAACANIAAPTHPNMSTRPVTLRPPVLLLGRPCSLRHPLVTPICTRAGVRRLCEDDAPPLLPEHGMSRCWCEAGCGCRGVCSMRRTTTSAYDGPSARAGILQAETRTHPR